MVRRYWRRKPWVRPRSKLKRGVLPEGDSFSGSDLAAIAGVGVKTLATWRKAGLLPRAPPGRRGARYSREVARRACAIGKAGSAAARLPRFNEMIPLILDETPPAAPPSGAATVDASAAEAWPDGSTTQSTVWHRIALLAGVELHVAEGAPPFVQEIIRDIARRFSRAR